MSTPPAPKDGATSKRLSRQRRRDTDPELAIRRELHRRGLRYRVDHKVKLVTTRTRVDIAFTRSKVAVFVDGCFWHGCPEHFTIPASNRDWWLDKIGANKRRDERATAELQSLGWTVVRIWEHEDSASAANLIEQTKRKSDASDEAKI